MRSIATCNALNTNFNKCNMQIIRMKANLVTCNALISALTQVAMGLEPDIVTWSLTIVDFTWQFQYNLSLSAFLSLDPSFSVAHIKKSPSHPFISISLSFLMVYLMMMWFWGCDHAKGMKIVGMEEIWLPSIRIGLWSKFLRFHCITLLRFS